MDDANTFDLQVIGRPEGEDKEKTDEEEGPRGVVFFLLGHWFVG